MGTPKILQSGLVQSLREKGRDRPFPGNASELLADPADALLITAGSVDVFAVTVDAQGVRGARRYLYTAQCGDLLLGTTPRAIPTLVGEGAVLALVAVGTTDARVLEVNRGELVRADTRQRAAAVQLLERALSLPGEALAPRTQARYDVLLAPGDEGEGGEGALVGARKPLPWLTQRVGALQFQEDPELTLPPSEAPFPLPRGVTLAWSEPGSLQSVATREAIRREDFLQGVDQFFHLFLARLERVLSEESRMEQEWVDRRRLSDVEETVRSLSTLGGVLDRKASGQEALGEEPLVAALSQVGHALGLRFRLPGGWERGEEVVEQVEAICRSSQVGYRRVVLSPDWWKQDNGPLLGFREEEVVEPEEAVEVEEAVGMTIRYAPVALVQDRKGRYERMDPERGERGKVEVRGDADLATFAFQFYRTLPSRAIGLRDLWSFVLFGVWNDIRTLLLVGILGSGLGLLTPLLTGFVFDQAIPGADLGALAAVLVALVVATLAGTAFSLTREVAGLRLSTRVSASLQVAVYHRLLRLPLSFHRGYSVGDLTHRASGINDIGNSLGGATLSTLLSSIVSAGAFFLLLYYSVALTGVAVFVVAITGTFTAVVAWLALKYTREEQAAEGALAGLMLQLLKGIQKIRVSATEARAFGRWAEAFHRQALVGLRAGYYQNRVGAFNALISVVSTLLLFGAYTRLAAGPGGGLTTGEFIAFNAAFGMFVSATLSLSDEAIDMLSLIPTWERAKPILDAVPETEEGKPDPGELMGGLEVSRLTFSYGADSPVILDDVSLHARPGEFIALVGPSGAGKSTLLRILLGFERPEVSSVFFDGHDLATVDISAVRRQIGVVLQSSTLTAGTIFDNVVGTSRLTLEDAWEAVRMAGMSQEVEDMPMGIHTVVTEGGGTLSGGQRQRLLIARALAHRPRILFLDEATSALDNRTQKAVSESIERLQATRVVVAHRLSTIRNADRIYVLDGGRVVQAGTYDELVAKPGIFRELASRQEL